MCAPEQNQLMAREALIYGLSEASGPLFEVATLTGFEADCSQSGAPTE